MATRQDRSFRYFFYGTLLDPDVQEIVIGRRIRGRHMQPAFAEGYRRVFVSGAWYPTLAEAPGSSVAGMVVSGLSAAERERIHQFEDDAYVLKPVAVRRRRLGPVNAHVYMPPGPEFASDRSWSLEEWRRRFKSQYLRRSKRWMISDFDQGW